MKNYTITVNGNVYDVVVEEAVKGEVTTSAVRQKPAPERIAKEAHPIKAGAGSIRVEAGAAGKVFKLETKVGQTLKAGDPVVIIEAMKMEIPVVAPKNGTVASIDVAVGDTVEAGTLLATLN